MVQGRFSLGASQQEMAGTPGGRDAFLLLRRAVLVFAELTLSALKVQRSAPASL